MWRWSSCSSRSIGAWAHSIVSGCEVRLRLHILFIYISISSDFSFSLANALSLYIHTRAHKDAVVTVNVYCEKDRPIYGCLPMNSNNSLTSYNVEGSKSTVCDSVCETEGERERDCVRVCVCCQCTKKKKK